MRIDQIVSKATLVSLLLVFSLPLSAQKLSHKLTGQIVDAGNSQPLEYATVAILNPTDSSLISGGITDESGKFQLSTSPGSVLVKAQFLSYDDSYSKLEIPQNEQSYDMGRVNLKTSLSQLDEVIVTGEQDNLQLALDKRIFNVGKNSTNAGRNAADILDNIPSVEVDIEGNVSLRGNNNVNILIDGRPSGLVGLNNPDALRMLQGNIIERIEVITNPSARYDAEGSAGIINIVLKKDNKRGFNGSINAGIGSPDRHNVTLNLNFRSEKINYFINYGIGYDNTPGSAIYRQRFFNEDTTYFTNVDRYFKRGGLSQNLRGGADYYINDKSTLTAAILVSPADEENTSTVDYRDFDINRSLINTTNRVDNETEPERIQEYSLNYKKTFDKEDHNLNIYTQFRNTDEKEESDITETASDKPMTTFQSVVNKELERNFMLQADYIKPISEDGKMEIGMRSNLRKINNNYLVEELENGSWNSLEGFSNDFIYTENIHALYFLIGNKHNKITYQVGARTELTDININQVTTGDNVDKDYIGLFPTAHFTYKIDDITSLQASYSRRLSRPSFRYLNPFSSFSDVRNLRNGNPDLDPQYTNSYEVGYLKNFETSSIFIGTYYQYSTGVVTRIYRVDDNGNTTSRPENLSDRNAYGIELTGNKDLLNWWKVNMSFNFFRTITDGFAAERRYYADNYTWTSRATSKMNIWKNVDFQMNFSYRGPTESTQGTRKSVYRLDLGLTKDILDNKGTVVISVQDLFNTYKYRYTNFGEDFHSNNVYQRRQRQFQLTFSYRINQKKIGNKERNEGGSGGLDDL
ncbi:MAG: TonB-dependent receptor [Cyclobacteriaceae bacterium]